MPSRQFDMLKEDFDYFAISSVLFGVIVASIVSQKLAARKALARAWKQTLDLVTCSRHGACSAAAIVLIICLRSNNMLCCNLLVLKWTGLLAQVMILLLVDKGNYVQAFQRLWQSYCTVPVGAHSWHHVLVCRRSRPCYYVHLVLSCASNRNDALYPLFHFLYDSTNQLLHVVMSCLQ